FAELVKRVKIVDTNYVAEHILNIPGVVIFEGSQGVLLDRFFGFHPYTTKVRTTPRVALDLLKECAYTGDIKSFGVLRAYHTRHGAGPFVTESSLLTKQLPDMTNKDHPWQGSFRVGSFDAVAARYALEAVGKASIHGLVITCLDRLREHKTWNVCNAYTPSGDMLETQSFLEHDGNTVVNIVADTISENAHGVERQAELGKLLYHCVPKNTTFNIPLQNKRFLDLCVSTLETMLNCPIVAVSIGPTENDKIVI
ncbi:MAG: adenylosuccinate synthetase, partial [Parcubacteria group bacterium]|nr:adenylosuccinate synthetase [Parcubacteria group bacterium]